MRPPVVVEWWEGGAAESAWTTVANWDNKTDVTLEGRRYSWRKRDRFLRLVDLPARTGARFELALINLGDEDRALLARHGWAIRPGLEISHALDRYVDYVRSSRGELSAAKELNVETRSGWFSDRSVCYLAAGRPVVAEDTGFSAWVPTGEGLFAFREVEEAAAAVREIEADYARHSAAARAIAREYFSAERVIARMIEEAA